MSQLSRSSEANDLADSGGAGGLGAPGKRTRTAQLQRKSTGSSDASAAGPAPAGGAAARSPDPFWFASGGGALAAAEHGVGSASSALPHGEAIQASFGHHDVSGVRAQVGGAASEACSALGASAFALGSEVGFGAAPDLHTAAHEAAHVVQQRGGVQLKGGVGEDGDVYERHADAVADRVVAGQSAESLLDAHASVGGAARAVQRKPEKKKDDEWKDDDYPELKLKFIKDDEGLITFTVMGGKQDGRELLWDSSDRIYVWGDTNDTATNELQSYKGKVELNNDGGKTYNFKKGGGVKVIDLADLDKVKMRDKLKDPSSLIEAMKAHVPLDPIKVEETHEGIQIVDGFTRLTAARKLGYKTIPVIFTK